MELSTAIRRIRGRLGESQAEFSEAFEVARNTVSQYETGRITPSFRVLADLLPYTEGEEERTSVLEVIRAQLSPGLRGTELSQILQRLEDLKPMEESPTQRAIGRRPRPFTEFLRLAIRVVHEGIAPDENILEILRLWADHGREPRASRHFRDAAAFLRVQLAASDGKKKSERIGGRRGPL